MLVFFILCVVSVHIVVGNGTLSPADHAAIKVPSGQVEQILKNKTIVGEGGVIVPDTVAETLLKENQTILINLDRELGTQTKEKPVKARKGVLDDLPSSQSSLEVKLSLEPNNNTVSKDINRTLSTVEPKQILNKGNVINKLKEHEPIVKKDGNLMKQNETEVRKKPLILSYDTLAMMNQSFSSLLQSSSKTLVSDQMQSPNDDSVRIYSINANRHPGMVMPVVITILVVPMFAVLGYMALKRGKEAWKNRHYKRMDFLLDGMYND